MGLALAGAIASTLISCADVDTVDSRAEFINLSVANYSNEAILLNLARASKSEPLAFVSLTGATGHNTISGSVGVPSITIGPHTPVVPPAQIPARNFLFGPNSAMRSAGNDFNVNVVDDPGSYAALLAPVNPAIIGFFINQGYSRELLFLLFVDRIRISNSKTTEEYENSPVGPDDFEAVDQHGQAVPSFQQINMECFGNYLALMIREGFTAQVDVDALPAGHAIPANRFCADPGLSVWFREGLDSKVCRGLISEAPSSSPFRTRPTGRLRPFCNSETRWTLAKADSSSNSSSSQSAAQSGGTQGTSAKATAAGTGDVTVTLTNELPKKPPADSTQAITKATTTGSTPVTVSVTAPAPVKKPPDKSEVLDPCTGDATGQKISDPRPGYDLCIDGRLRVQVFLRSTFGVYQYLGKMIARRSEYKLFTGLDADHDLLTISHDVDYCFVNVSYEGEQYCVPTSADNTKHLFALLRQLVGLNTSPQNQTTTLTVRTTP